MIYLFLFDKYKYNVYPRQFLILHTLFRKIVNRLNYSYDNCMKQHDIALEIET